MESETWRLAKHLRRELGENLFGALVNSENTGRVRVVAKRLFAEMSRPTQMIVGGITYEILKILRGEEECVDTQTLYDRAKETGACFGVQESLNIFHHQDEIPVELREGSERMAFVFLKRRRSLPSFPEEASTIVWDAGVWSRRVGFIYSTTTWNRGFHLLRRKSSSAAVAAVNSTE